MKFAPCCVSCVVMLGALAVLAGAANARQVYVPGFYRPNGVWVAPHYRTVPDGTVYDGAVYPNGTPYTGAVNPYTGTVVPYTGAPVPTPYPYGAYPYQAPYQSPYVPPPASVAPVPYYGTP